MPNALKKLALSTALLLSAVTLPATAFAQEHGKVLVILLPAPTSSNFRDGKSYHTGYYLDELEIPLFVRSSMPGIRRSLPIRRVTIPALIRSRMTRCSMVATRQHVRTP